jgi:hypothetical protein
MGESRDSEEEIAPPKAGFIYLLHWYDRKGRVEHYIGWTRDLEARLKCHYGESGGCPTTKKYRRAGLRGKLARLWRGTVWGERKLQQTLDFPTDCPICRGELIENVPCEGWVKADTPPTGPLKAWNRGSR